MPRDVAATWLLQRRGATILGYLRDGGFTSLTRRELPVTVNGVTVGDTLYFSGEESDRLEVVMKDARGTTLRTETLGSYSSGTCLYHPNGVTERNEVFVDATNRHVYLEVGFHWDGYYARPVRPSSCKKALTWYVAWALPSSL